MPHPFFDAIAYPWHREDAVAAHRELYTAIKDPKRIAAIYERCGDALRPLHLQQEPDLIWRDVLDNLTRSRKLAVLIGMILSDSALASIHTTLKAMEHPPIDYENADSSRVAEEARRDAIGLDVHFRFLQNTDVIVHRSYLNASLNNNTFSFNAFSDTGTPHDPVVWIFRKGTKNYANVGRGFYPLPDRPNAYRCVATFSPQKRQSPHHVVTKYSWKGAGILSKEMIERLPASAKGYLYAQFLEHAFVKCPPMATPTPLHISVDLPRPWAPDDLPGNAMVFTRSENQKEPRLSSDLTECLVYDGEGHLAIRVSDPKPGTTYILAWRPRDEPRS